MGLAIFGKNSHSQFGQVIFNHVTGHIGFAYVISESAQTEQVVISQYRYTINFLPFENESSDVSKFRKLQLIDKNVQTKREIQKDSHSVCALPSSSPTVG